MSSEKATEAEAKPAGDAAKSSPPADTEEYDVQQQVSKAAQSTNKYQFFKKPSTGSGTRPRTATSQSSQSKSGRSTSEQKEPPQKCHYEVRYNYNLETHCSKIDESFVDYLMDSERGNFIIYFDQSLYEPPQIILNLEKELESIEQELLAKKKK